MLQGLRNFFRPAVNMPTPTEKAVNLVKDTVSGHKVAVFSKTYCPFCIKAKRALGSLIKQQDIYVVELDSVGNDMVDIQNALCEVTGARSVPRVFIGGQFIGGGDETVAKLKSGELAKLLQAQGLEVAAA